MRRRLSQGLSKYAVFVTVLVSLLVLSIPISVVKADPPPTHVVSFPDSNLETVIRGAIGKPAGDILQSDLDGLTVLDGSNRGIVNIAGLEHCTSLRWLYLHENQIGDISPLSGLTSLTVLYLSNNGISDISLLSGLTSLYLLDVYDNQISDISPLSGLTSLTALYLSYNQISDIPSLASLTSLTTLWLSYNQISHISPHPGLTSLTTLLLDSNQISDISPLSGLTSLTYLNLSNNQISDISPVFGLTSLTHLDLSNNQISEISPVSGLTSLTHLDLGHNHVSDIASVAGLTSLTYLFLHDNQISEISPVSGLTSLTVLEFWTNQISDIKALVNNTGLASGDYVSLSANPLSSTSIDVYVPQLQARGLQVFYDVPHDESPNEPTNVSPVNGATDISLTPTLQSSTYSDLDDAHAASMWQIRESSGFYPTAVLTWTSDTDLTSFTVPSGILNCDTTYYWHVSYQDDLGSWSPVSSETSFTTTSGYHVPTATGTGTATLAPDSGSMQDLTAVSLNSLPSQAIASQPPGVQFPHGLFEFQITGLANGESMILTITFPSPVPTGAQYWKYGPTPTEPLGEWYTIFMGDNDGDNVITITLTDGELGDDDLMADGTIIDQGGPGWPGPSGGGGGHSAPAFPSVYMGIGAALGAGVLAYAVRRRLAER